MTEELRHEEVPEPEEETRSGDGEETMEDNPVPEEDGPAEAAARLSELEQKLADRDAEIAGLRQKGEELTQRCETLSSALTEAVSGYRDMVKQANPDVVGDLIEGDTIVSINESLEKAKTLVSRVRQGLEEEISLMKVPAGAPERTSPDLSTLSPREKIRYAIGGNE